MLKIARANFVYAFTAFFALIATMGEGLHFLPGMGHFCEHDPDCALSCMPDVGLHSSPICHTPTFSHSGKESEQLHNAADCAVCTFLSLAKSCPPALTAACDFTPIVERLAICFSHFQSRFVGSYLSRGPPCDLLHV
jgi:hypothetical protein